MGLALHVINGLGKECFGHVLHALVAVDALLQRLRTILVRLECDAVSADGERMIAKSNKELSVYRGAFVGFEAGKELCRIMEFSLSIGIHLDVALGWEDASAKRFIMTQYQISTEA